MSVGFSADGCCAISGSWDKTIKLFRVTQQPNDAVVKLREHSEDVYTSIFDRSGNGLASGSRDGTIRIWDVGSGKLLRTLDEPDRQPVTGLSFSPDGSRLASASGNDSNIKNDVSIWNLSTYKRDLTLEGHSRRVSCVEYCPSGRVLASGSYDGTIKIWNPIDGRLLQTIEADSSQVFGLNFSNDGKLLASCGTDKTVKLWDVETGKRLCELAGHKHFVTSVVFSHNGLTLASGSRDNSIILWDISRQTSSKAFVGHEDLISSLSFLPNDTRLASASLDGSVKLWDVESGEEVRTFLDHTDGVNSVSFSPNGTKLASGSRDNLVIIWDASPRDETRTQSPFFQRECELRENLARHREQAQAATAQNERYAATFHCAWVMKSDPALAESYDQLHEANDKLKAEYAEQGKDLTPDLHPVVIEMLKLPRGNKQATDCN